MDHARNSHKAESSCAFDQLFLAAVARTADSLLLLHASDLESFVAGRFVQGASE